MSRFPTFVLLLASITLLCSGCASMRSVSPAPWSKDDVIERMRSVDVDRVVVYYYRETASLFEAMNESRLERNYSSCIIIQDFKDSLFRDRLINAFSISSMKPSDRASRDLRWGCIFFDENGKRLVTLYFAPNHGAVINGTELFTDDKVTECLRTEFKCIIANW
jgi:hypothetical protein